MSDWQAIKLKDCLTIRHGRNQKEVETPDGKYPILGTGGQIGRADKYLYDKPSVLIGRKGTIDKPRYMDKPFWTVDTLFYSEIKDNAVPRFIYYVFNTINWRYYNEASGVPSLSASTISNIKINLPDKTEQKRIVGVLEVWDSCIELLDKKIMLKEQLKKGLMQQLLTGKKRLPEFTDEWQKITIVEFAGGKEMIVDGPFGSNLKTSDYVEQGIPVLQGLNATGDKFNRKGLRFISENKARELYRSNARIGDLITVKIGSIGFSAIIDDLGGSQYAIIPANLLRVRVKNQNCNIKFLYYYLTSAKGKRMIRDIASGNAQPAISLSGFRNLKIYCPKDPEEQLAIAQILDVCTNEIDRLQDLRDVLGLQKKYLLKHLISGTIRVPEVLELDKEKPQKEVVHA